MEGTLTIVEASAAEPLLKKSQQRTKVERPQAARLRSTLRTHCNCEHQGTRSLPAGQVSSSPVTNTGALEHDFAIDELDIQSRCCRSGKRSKSRLPDDLRCSGDTYDVLLLDSWPPGEPAWKAR